MHIFAISGRRKSGQGSESPPAFVTEFVPFRFWIVKTLNDVPIFVARMLLVLADIFESKEIAPGVIENSVDDHVHTALVTSLQKLQK